MRAVRIDSCSPDKKGKVDWMVGSAAVGNLTRLTTRLEPPEHVTPTLFTETTEDVEVVTVLVIRHPEPGVIPSMLRFAAR